VIRVFLADDETLVREGIRRLLELAPAIEVVGEARDGEEAIEAISRIAPDVVLLDVRMPRRNGIEVLRELRERGMLRPTLLLTTFDDAETVIEGIRAGARGYMLKDVSLEQLVGAIETLAKGGSMFLPGVTEHLLRNFDKSAVDFDRLEEPDALTHRERAVLQLMTGGYSNREIARALNTAEGTIKNHVSNILSKLGVRDRTRAVLKAIESGLL
jgi:DNA-binding NarL/FixJ family response regulator